MRCSAQRCAPRTPSGPAWGRSSSPVLPTGRLRQITQPPPPAALQRQGLIGGWGLPGGRQQHRSAWGCGTASCRPATEYRRLVIARGAPGCWLQTPGLNNEGRRWVGQRTCLFGASHDLSYVYCLLWQALLFTLLQSGTVVCMQPENRQQCKRWGQGACTVGQFHSLHWLVCRARAVDGTGSCCKRCSARTSRFWCHAVIQTLALPPVSFRRLACPHGRPLKRNE